MNLYPFAVQPGKSLIARVGNNLPPCRHQVRILQAGACRRNARHRQRICSIQSLSLLSRSGRPTATPQRMPAMPYIFENVRSTMRSLPSRNLVHHRQRRRIAGQVNVCFVHQQDRPRRLVDPAPTQCLPSVVSVPVGIVRVADVDHARRRRGRNHRLHIVRVAYEVSGSA